MDLFEKLRPCELAAEAMEKGIYPYFHALETRQDIQVVMEGKRRIMLGSNNYLGLTNNPEVIEAGKKALDQYGSGCSGSRFLNGTLKMHLELEEELADFPHKEAVVTFLRVSVQSWHYQRPCRPPRLYSMRPREPRKHIRRLPPIPGDYAALPPWGHG